ncbi:MAG: MoaD/ThiS family protein [Planctomycetes bacterium]|nr:MoaD/ThiS family protein [Planctomycetota bacterium]NOG53278.1 MoaD/ThiS family protein [Planctomycetota bacterium]
MSRIELSVKMFGPLARLAGARSEVTITVPEGVALNSEQVTQLLGAQYPDLAASLPACRLAVNHEFAGADQPISPTDELALVGMVSGG